MRARSSSAGFTLVEVLAAMALLATVATGVAGLLASTMATVRRAREQTFTVVLAMQKMEQLRALDWGFDAPGDDDRTDLSAVPWSSAGAGLSVSPAGTLDANTPGYVDYLDRHGAWVGTGASVPADAVFIRRWHVERAAGAPAETLLLQVLVTTRRREALVLAAGQPRRKYAEDALVQTLKARKAS